ncbi:MAG: hypothetical protein WAO95_03250 [Burkholderiales bacterium]
MRWDVLRRLGPAVLVATAAALHAGAALGQEMRRNAPAIRGAPASGGMGMITLSLLEIGRQTAFFLAVGDRIKMTDEQRAQIVEIAFQFQKLAGERSGDLGVAQAELQRILTRDQINLAQVKVKLREIQALQADMEYAAIESLLKVIRLLTHEQHVLAMAIAATSESDKPRAMSGSSLNQAR